MTSAHASSLNRREFLIMLAGMAGGLMVHLAPASAGQRGQDGDALGSALPRRRLGATGEDVTILGLGGWHLGGVSGEAEARRLVDVALEEGVRFFDTAESYQAGKSERWLGAALAAVRGDVFLMTKTYDPAGRDREGAKRHLEGSLERLGTDYLDLWQLHAIRSPEDVDRAFAPGGAMEYLLAMKARGVIRYVGVTGHASPAAHLRALDHFDRGTRFDCMQMPVNPLDFHQQSFQRAVLPGLVERGIGVIAMKTSASGALVRERICSIDECLRFVWTLPVSLAVVGMETPEQVRHNARLARDVPPMTPDEMERLLARIEDRKDLSLERYKSV